LTELQAGRVGRAHGLDGSFYVTRPRQRLLAPGTSVQIAGRQMRIERRSGTQQRPIVRLQGVSTRAAAEELRGLDLRVDSSQAPPLEAGEWWAHELEGCAVADGELALGTVARLIELPSCEALEVSPPSGGQPLLVPMVHAAIRNVDVAGRRIEVDSSFLDLPGAGQRRGPA
jgi:16S rRNA processing protein RimM